MSDSKDKKKSEKEIIKDKFFAFLKATSLRGDLDRDHVHVGHSYGRNCLLLGWSHQPYAEAINAMHSKHPKVSEKAIGQVLSKSMVKLFEQFNISEDADPESDAPVMDSILNTLDSAAVEKEVTNILNSLKSHIKSWSVYIFIEGLKLEGSDKLQLGATTLYSKDHGPLVDALKDMKETRSKKIAQSIEKNIGHCNCYLIIDVEGEEKFANHEALRQAQNVINVLSLFITIALHKESHYKSIRLLGQTTLTHNQTVFKHTPPVGENEESKHYLSRTDLVPVRHHEITSTKVQQWKEYGLDKALECVELSDSTAYPAEARIHSAITWYGRAMNADTYEEQFVSLTIALESLLVADERLTITQRLADEISGLLGGNFQDRERIRQKIRDLYNSRSRIVHAGVPVSKASLRDLDDIVTNTILAFISKEISEP